MNATLSTRALEAVTTNLEQEFYDKLHAEKYRDKDQTFEDHAKKIASRLSNNPRHEQELTEILLNKRFLPAGRVQAALGAVEREVSPFNCAVSQKIEDSMASIMDAVTKAAMILRLGTGIGYNFSHLRPKGTLIKKLQTESSGPVSFMKIFDVMASTIASSGHRRGAQMGILNVNHPDILEFIDAKMEKGAFRQFNLSVGITDAFISAVREDVDFPLTFGGRTYSTVRARVLWEKILKNAYDSAEPGIIFIDRLNQNNNLYYCEVIEATNPCAEQPLPPYGLCCLGSFNLVSYVNYIGDKYKFNYNKFEGDIRNVVRAYDNIFGDAVYAISEHDREAKSKRRIGLGLTGIASGIELLTTSSSYGDKSFCDDLDNIAALLTNVAYDESAEISKEKGPFPLYDERYLDGNFIKTLNHDVQSKIRRYGIRNSHLISYAPCGTISQCAGNVSSGVEPIFYHSVSRDVYMRDGLQNVTLNDYNVREYGFYGKTLDECSVEDHLNVAKIIQKYTDSAISKTVNVPANCSFNDYRKIYDRAFDLGLKGITVYRPNDLRGIVIKKAEENPTKTIEQAFTSCANGLCNA